VSAGVSAWRWFGRRPAVEMLGALYVLVLLTGVALGTSVAERVGVGFLAAFCLYCFARPRAGWEVYGLALLPGTTAWLLHVLTGAPRWIGLLLIPVSLWMARAEDRKDADLTRPERSAPTSSPAPL
jgi:hypothetical protein